MTGSSVFDYVHAEDHNELAEHLGLGLTMNSNLASPNSNTSEDGTSGTIGTHNPDGIYELIFFSGNMFSNSSSYVHPLTTQIHFYVSYFVGDKKTSYL